MLIVVAFAIQPDGLEKLRHQSNASIEHATRAVNK